MNEYRIDDVIEICIEYCQMQENPIEHVETFVAGLKTAGWSDVDAHAVEEGAKNAFRDISETAEIDRPGGRYETIG